MRTLSHDTYILLYYFRHTLVVGYGHFQALKSLTLINFFWIIKIDQLPWKSLPTHDVPTFYLKVHRSCIYMSVFFCLCGCFSTSLFDMMVMACFH